MDLLPSYLVHIRGPGSNCLPWTYITVTLWVFQNLFLSDGSTASVALNETVVSSSSSEAYTNNHEIMAASPLLMSASVYDNDGSVDIKRCQGCRSGENGEECSGEDQGECDCTNENVTCRCKHGWAGDSCQYKTSKISCEKMRSCILCHVHKIGSLADERDCHYYCHRSYPTPIIVKALHFQDDEHLCSFVHHKHASDKSDSSDCRYFFKYGKIKADGNLDPSTFYIVAQQVMDCGKSVKFPQLKSNSSIDRNNKSFQVFAKNYEEIIKDSEEGDETERKNSFTTVVIVFVFVALPFVTCIFALIYNFSNLPCGLCNMFRQSSSKYLRNVRPFPGFVPADQTTQL